MTLEFFETSAILSAPKLSNAKVANNQYSVSQYCRGWRYDLRVCVQCSCEYVYSSGKYEC